MLIGNTCLLELAHKLHLVSFRGCPVKLLLHDEAALGMLPTRSLVDQDSMLGLHQLVQRVEFGLDSCKSKRIARDDQAAEVGAVLGGEEQVFLEVYEVEAKVEFFQEWKWLCR